MIRTGANYSALMVSYPRYDALLPGINPLFKAVTACTSVLRRIVGTIVTLSSSLPICLSLRLRFPEKIKIQGLDINDDALVPRNGIAPMRHYFYVENNIHWATHF